MPGVVVYSKPMSRKAPSTASSLTENGEILKILYPQTTSTQISHFFPIVQLTKFIIKVKMGKLFNQSIVISAIYLRCIFT